VRADACDNCGLHIKTIDFTASGTASPLVDDLASLPLDLWAVEQGYRKIRPNLLRL
jgi:formate dehydrogenase maturation protein FdhE